MKRYRILTFMDFDTRCLTLSEPINEEWEERVKGMHEQNRANTIARLKAEYGELYSDTKIENFVALGPKPFSVIAFHNVFFPKSATLS